MMKSNSDLRTEARNYLSGKWIMSAVAALLYAALCGVVGGIPFVNIAALVVIPPLIYGLSAMFLKGFRTNTEINVGQIFDGFSDYGRILGTVLLTILYIFLWSLLLYIPGIIKSCSYSMTNYILVDRPELRYNGAIEESMRMMQGHKMKFFLLMLSFIGWAILTLFTFGIGYFFLVPYIQSSTAAFYENLKAEQQIS